MYSKNSSSTYQQYKDSGNRGNMQSQSQSSRLNTYADVNRNSSMHHNSTSNDSRQYPSSSYYDMSQMAGSGSSMASGYDYGTGLGSSSQHATHNAGLVQQTSDPSADYMRYQTSNNWRESDTSSQQRGVGKYDMVSSNMGQGQGYGHTATSQYYDSLTAPSYPYDSSASYKAVSSVARMPNTMSYAGSYYQQQSSIHSQPPLSQPQQVNIVQRISMIIKPHLPQLKRIMSKANPKKHESSARTRRHSRSPRRDRSRDRDRRHHDRDGRDRDSESQRKSSATEWVCGKCSFLNFQWRQKCKKCNDSRPSKKYSQGPEDWKCTKCQNLNYARRNQCNRCHLPKPVSR